MPFQDTKASPTGATWALALGPQPADTHRPRSPTFHPAHCLKQSRGESLSGRPLKVILQSGPGSSVQGCCHHAGSPWEGSRRVVQRFANAHNKRSANWSCCWLLPASSCAVIGLSYSPESRESIERRLGSRGMRCAQGAPWRRGALPERTGDIDVRRARAVPGGHYRVRGNKRKQRLAADPAVFCLSAMKVQ